MRVETSKRSWKSPLRAAALLLAGFAFGSWLATLAPAPGPGPGPGPERWSSWDRRGLPLEFVAGGCLDREAGLTWPEPTHGTDDDGPEPPLSAARPGGSIPSTVGED